MLKLENIHKFFEIGTVNEKHILKGVNLEVNDGDFITIIGGNGAGKSTLLNSVAGTFPVTSGKIFIDGDDVTAEPEFRRGKKRTLRWGITERERGLYRELLSQLDLGLEHRLKDKTRFLSGGQRQALTLLMASFHQPKLLLLDEHTAALDPKTAAKVLDLTVKIVEEEKLTAMMVTHNMKDALRIGNRLIMLHNGNIILDLSKEEKQNMEVSDLLKMFERASGEEMDNDRMLLG